MDVSCHLQKIDTELRTGHEYSYSELQHVAVIMCKQTNSCEIFLANLMNINEF